MTAAELEALLAKVPERAAESLPSWSGRSRAAEGAPVDSQSGNVSAYQSMAGGRPAVITEDQRRSTEMSVLRRQSAIEGRIDPWVLARLRSAVTPCALLIGPTGVGKTSGAAWIMGRYGGLLMRARDLAAANRRHGLGEGQPRELELAHSKMVLVIDDIGTEGSDVAALQDVLDYRYGKCLPTVVTSGLTMQELTSHLGHATFRRVIDQHVPSAHGEYPVLVVDAHPKES